MTRAPALLLALSLAACAEPAPYCGGFEDPLTYELSLARLTLDITEIVPVEGELCIEQPRSCECVGTDAEGLIRLEAPPHTDILGTIHATGYAPTILVHTTGDADRFAVLRVIDRPTLSILAGSIGERIDRTTGQLALRAAPAEGADVTGSVFVLRNLDTGDLARVIYTAAGVPDVEATATDDTGVMLGVNLPPGRYEAESAVLASCGVVDAGWPRYDAEGRLRALEFEVRADSVTLIDALRCFGPTPP